MKILPRLPFFISAFALFAASASWGQNPYKVHILDATVRDKTVPGAEVILQKPGQSSLKATTDASGTAEFSAPFQGGDDGTMNLIVKKDGYSTLVVKCPCDDLTYALSPVQKSLDGLRIVLNWGANPRDLDSHLVYSDQHVFFNSKIGNQANLDVDDTTSFGPETITIEKKLPDTKYLYVVQNYSDWDKPNSTGISKISQAKVFVYVGSSLVRTFLPPRDKAGNTWIVFGIGEDGEFYDINQFTSIDSRDGVGEGLAQKLLTGQFVSDPVMQANSKDEADRFNREGEKAYHDKRLEDSVRLYSEAINLNPEHSQAYSNLGLSYQKLGKYAEAIWANRKAIALASGSKANVVKASSFYNIARVYEEQGRWREALDAFQQALNHRTHDAYKKGIERMKQKIEN